MGSLRASEQPAPRRQLPVNLIVQPFEKIRHAKRTKGGWTTLGVLHQVPLRGEDLTFPSPGSCK